MTNEIQPSTTTELNPTPFGVRLKSAREALSLERKDAAAQLRLNEKIIIMMEKDTYPPDLPVTFIRGYIRAYGKLLQLPEHEIKKAIEPIQLNSSQHLVSIGSISPTRTIKNGRFMQIFNYLIIATLIGLVSMWWYSHSNTSPVIADNQTTLAGTSLATNSETQIGSANPIIPITPDNKPTTPAELTTASAEKVATTITKPTVKVPPMTSPKPTVVSEEEDEDADTEDESTSEHAD